MIHLTHPLNSILNFRFKRPLSVQSIAPSAHRDHRNGEEHRDPSSETHKSIPLGCIRASQEIYERTHVEKSYLDSVFCSKALKSCAKVGNLREGKQLHSCIIKMGYDCGHSLHNHILNMYVKCRELKDAYRVFDEMPKRNVVPWNVIISGMVGYGGNLRRSGNDAVLLFKEMLVNMVEPDYITFIGLLGACVELNDIEVVRQLQCFIVKLNFSLNHMVGSSLVDQYGKCGFVEDARRLFDEFISVDLVLWNVMISCYSLNGYFEEAFEVFQLMRSEGEKGDEFTFSNLLSSCGTLGCCKLGKQIHGLIIRLSCGSDVLVASALVDMYAKNRCLDDARRAFDGMITRNVVLWTTIIVGYGKNGNGKEAVKLLKQMVQGGFKPDELTLASILSSCAEMAAITEIIQVHAHAVKNGLEVHLSVGNALINAYSKCGNIASACTSFGSIVKPNIVTWTSIIAAYAFHGLPKQAVETFETMLSKGVKPDRIAFVEILSACSHGGLVNEGSHYFTTMTRDHQIVPDSEHYACIVDLLGRSGHLEEAYHILVNTPSEPSPNVLGSFIWACRAHGNVAQAKWATEKLFAMEPNEPVNYTVMSNIYASAGCWIDVARVRKMMRDNCSNKVPGCSWIENGGSVHTFLSGDELHQQTKAIYTMLGWLISAMRVEGYMSKVTPQHHKIESQLYRCLS